MGDWVVTLISNFLAWRKRIMELNIQEYWPMCLRSLRCMLEQDFARCYQTLWWGDWRRDWEPCVLLWNPKALSLDEVILSLLLICPYSRLHLHWIPTQRRSSRQPSTKQQMAGWLSPLHTGYQPSRTLTKFTFACYNMSCHFVFWNWVDYLLIQQHVKQKSESNDLKEKESAEVWVNMVAEE